MSLAKQTPRRTRSTAASADAALPLSLYLSTAIEGDIAQLLGAPHYSYHFAARRFADLLTGAGYAPHRVAMPEGYATRESLPGGTAGRNVHLIFRSTEQIRLLKPAVNICCFPWEFPVLKADTLPGEHPFLNQARMLRLCDEVWSPSEYGCAVLRQHGVSHVQRIPAPVPVMARAERGAALAGLRGLEAAGLRINHAWPKAHALAQVAAGIGELEAWLGVYTRGKHPPTVFLSILNPEDYRKSLDAMLRGFHHFRKAYPNSVLIVKALTSASRFSLAQVVAEVVSYKMESGTAIEDDGVVFINEYLSDAQMSLLYSLADFYLCTSLAEGQNLPLLEAMAHGTPVVTTCNTAMADYIDAANAFVIDDRAVANENIHLAGMVAQREFSVRLCGSRDVYRALCTAQESSPTMRRGRAAAALSTVAGMFSAATIWGLVGARLRHLTS